MPGIFIGYTQHVGGKWAHDYLVCPLGDFQIEKSTNTCRIFSIREIIPDCSGVDSFSTGYIFPLRGVKDHLTRTLGPHGDSTEVSFPRRGSMGKIHLSNKIPKRTTVIKHQPDSQEIEDSGSGGARRRRADTTRLINFDIHTWRKFTKAQREDIIAHVSSQAASSSSGQPIDSTSVIPSVSIIPDTFPIVSTVGGPCQNAFEAT